MGDLIYISPISQKPRASQIIGTMPDMDASDTDLAIKATAAALPAYRKTTARSKSQLLYKWYELLVQHADDLATLITAENGKPLHEAKVEVLYAAHYLEWFSGEATRLEGETIPASTANHRIYTIKEPVGVVGLITPWNWPIGMVTRKVGPVSNATTQVFGISTYTECGILCMTGSRCRMYGGYEISS